MPCLTRVFGSCELSSAWWYMLAAAPCSAWALFVCRCSVCLCLEILIGTVFVFHLRLQQSLDDLGFDTSIRYQNLKFCSCQLGYLSQRHLLLNLNSKLPKNPVSPCSDRLTFATFPSWWSLVSPFWIEKDCSTHLCSMNIESSTERLSLISIPMRHFLTH